MDFHERNHLWSSLSQNLVKASHIPITRKKTSKSSYIKKAMHKTANKL